MPEMPERLTAENGAKSLLIGEFYEVIHIEQDGLMNSGNYQVKVPVSWTTIKKIYRAAVEHYNPNTGQFDC